MPRTKAVKKKPAPKLSKAIESLKAFVESAKAASRESGENARVDYISKLKTQLLQSKLSIPQNVANKTLGELMDLPPHWTGNSGTSSILQVTDMTKSIMVKKKKPLRSSSFGDEGYLTAESSKSTSGDRQSRTRSRVQKTSRVSRSASAKPHTRSTDRFKTPAHKIPPMCYGTVTPKMKPNTPQVLLRRPKMGEVALSLQGSPLMTGSVVADNIANINIPLQDGRLISIQPERGLRLSQIPTLDLETKRQLETLRDNLNKVCSMTCRR